MSKHLKNTCIVIPTKCYNYANTAHFIFPRSAKSCITQSLRTMLQTPKQRRLLTSHCSVGCSRAEKLNNQWETIYGTAMTKRVNTKINTDAAIYTSNTFVTDVTS